MNFSKKNYELKKNNKNVVSKTYITLLIALFISLSTFAQGRGMNYKAVIKDGSGNVVASQVVKVRFSILDSDSNIDYQETHEPTTDANGIIVLSIGWGEYVSGSFWGIDWGNDFYFFKTDIDTLPFDDYVEFAEVIFNSVPYAYHAVKAYSAEIAENVTTKIDQLDDAKSDDDGSSVFIGQNAGLNDDGTNNRNVGVGFETLQANTFGYNNVANGHSALKANTEGHSNVANGANALLSNTTGYNNNATGSNALTANTEGYDNSATGFEALRFNTTGVGNTANGSAALRSNTSGNYNVANGNRALYSNTTGFKNTANGSFALTANTVGFLNTATGHEALKVNTTGARNTANGNFALGSNTSGDDNTANGVFALPFNNTGHSNTANGVEALFSNSTGHSNTAIGYSSLRFNNTGHSNTANGYEALFNNKGNQNTANGKEALHSNTTGYNNTASGYQALDQNITGHNNTAIGYNAQVTSSSASNQIRIGNTFIQSAVTQVAWTFPSDIRWKENVRALPYGLDMVMQLEPVDYVRKNNDAKTRDMGFIAQDVEALLAKIGYTDQGFLTKDDKGYLSIRYNDLLALLTKAMQEQQGIIETLSKDKSTLENTVNNLIARVEKIEANNQ